MSDTRLAAIRLGQRLERDFGRRIFEQRLLSVDLPFTAATSSPSSNSVFWHATLLRQKDLCLLENVLAHVTLARKCRTGAQLFE